MNNLYTMYIDGEDSGYYWEGRYGIDFGMSFFSLNIALVRSILNIGNKEIWA